MRKIIFLTTIYILFSLSAKSQLEIGKSIKIGILEIAQHDFPIKMNWNDATKACSELGENWRVPTRYELNYLFINQAVIGVFKLSEYWSSTEDEEGVAYCQNFANGQNPKSGKYQKYYVRAIRTIK
jgi:hypothetical protein